jgi:hypothetical protein
MPNRPASRRPLQVRVHHPGNDSVGCYPVKDKHLQRLRNRRGPPMFTEDHQPPVTEPPPTSVQESNEASTPAIDTMDEDLWSWSNPFFD